MEMQFLQGIMDTQIYALAVALYLLGIGIRKISTVKNNHIPVILGIVGIVFVALHIFATQSFDTPQQIAAAIFAAFVQGILCAAAAVYADQIFKQYKKLKSVVTTNEPEEETSDREDEDYN